MNTKFTPLIASLLVLSNGAQAEELKKTSVEVVPTIDIDLIKEHAHKRVQKVDLEQENKVVAPKDNLVVSQNGKFTLKINKEDKLYEIYQGEKMLWSFKKDVDNHVRFFSQINSGLYVLANDGQKVLWISGSIAEAGHQKKQAVWVRTPKNETFSKTYEEICEPKPQTMVYVSPPTGLRHFIWRTGDVTQNGDVISIKTVGKGVCKIDLNNLPK